VCAVHVTHDSLGRVSALTFNHFDPVIPMRAIAAQQKTPFFDG
jgi:hypothetical protein